MSNTMKITTSNATYEVTSEVLTRTDYGTFGDPDSAFETEYTQYNIYLDGNLVQFCFAEVDIFNAIARFEEPTVGVGSRFD